MIKGLIGRLGLAARIGAAIAAAVIAIQVLVTLVFLMHPPNWFYPFYKRALAQRLGGRNHQECDGGGRQSHLAFWQILPNH